VSPSAMLTTVPAHSTAPIDGGSSRAQTIRTRFSKVARIANRQVSAGHARNAISARYGGKRPVEPPFRSGRLRWRLADVRSIARHLTRGDAKVGRGVLAPLC